MMRGVFLRTFNWCKSFLKSWRVWMSLFHLGPLFFMGLHAEEFVLLLSYLFYVDLGKDVVDQKQLFWNENWCSEVSPGWKPSWLGCNITHRSGRPSSEDGGSPEKDKVEQWKFNTVIITCCCGVVEVLSIFMGKEVCSWFPSLNDHLWLKWPYSTAKMIAVI